MISGGLIDRGRGRKDGGERGGEGRGGRSILNVSVCLQLGFEKRGRSG